MRRKRPPVGGATTLVVAGCKIGPSPRVGRLTSLSSQANVEEGRLQGSKRFLRTNYSCWKIIPRLLSTKPMLIAKQHFQSFTSKAPIIERMSMNLKAIVSLNEDAAAG